MSGNVNEVNRSNRAEYTHEKKTNEPRAVAETNEATFEYDAGKPVDEFGGNRLTEAKVVADKPKEGNGSKILEGAAAAAVLIVTALTGGAAAAAIVAALGAIVVGLSSCTGPTYNINQSVGLNFQDKSNEEIAKLLKEQNMKLDTVIELLIEQGKSLKDILAITEIMGDNVQQILNKVISLGVDAKEIIGLLKESNDNEVKILDAIAGNGEKADEIKELLVRIKDATENGLDKNNELLTEILKQLTSLGNNQDAALDLLSKILAKVTEDVENDKASDAVTQKLLKDILAKLDTMDENQQVFFNAIFDNLDSMGEKGKVAVEKLLAAINANTEVAKGSQEILVEILGHLGKLGDKADKIIEIVSNLSIQGGNVDLTDVTDLLRQILAQEKANGTTLEAIYAKIDVIPAKLDKIEAKLVNLPQAGEYKELLTDIRDKIQHCTGHTCDHATLTQTLLEIKVLIEELKNKIGDNNNHEGILDDLNNIFG